MNFHGNSCPLGHRHPSPVPLNTPAFTQFITALEKVPILAHHPTCRYYDHHLIWLGNVPLCLGCFMMACGILTGTLLIPHLQFLTALPFQVLLGLGVILYIPAILQIWIQVKPYKILSRFSLGLAAVFLVYAGLWLTPLSIFGLILRGGFLVCFATVWHLTLKIRSTYSVSPCQHCPEGRFPVCSYTIPRIPRLATEYFAESDRSNPASDDFVRALQSIYPEKNESIRR